MSAAARAPLARRSALIALMIAAGIVTLGAAFFGLWFVSDLFGSTRAFSFTASYAAESWPAVPSAAQTNQFYDDIVIESYEPLVAQRIMQAIALAIPFLTAAVGGAGVVVLARRLLDARPFAGSARALLAALAVLCGAVGVVVPWLEDTASAGAASALGLARDGDAGATWIVVQPFGWDDIGWPMMMVSVLLALIAILWGQAARLQRDTEGLV